MIRSTQVKGYAKDDDNFDNFAGAVLALFVLTTEENFPMVADPSFTQRPAVSTGQDPAYRVREFPGLYTILAHFVAGLVEECTWQVLRTL